VVLRPALLLLLIAFHQIIAERSYCHHSNEANQGFRLMCISGSSN
jgi:hypothetical protein